MSKKNHTSRRAMTLTELLIGLTVLSILSVGATNLVISGLRTDRVLLDTNRQVSEMELSIRRMTHNLRTGSNITITGTNSVTLTSQADPTNNGQNYAITYTYDSSAQTLSETSSQYGATPNVIAYRVTAFTISQASASPLMISIDMTIGGSNITSPTRRTFQIWNRNS